MHTPPPTGGVATTGPPLRSEHTYAGEHDTARTSSGCRCQPVRRRRTFQHEYYQLATCSIGAIRPMVLASLMIRSIAFGGGCQPATEAGSHWCGDVRCSPAASFRLDRSRASQQGGEGAMCVSWSVHRSSTEPVSRSMLMAAATPAVHSWVVQLATSTSWRSLPRQISGQIHVIG